MEISTGKKLSHMGKNREKSLKIFPVTPPEFKLRNRGVAREATRIQKAR